MNSTRPDSRELGEQYLKSLDETYIGAAASKLLSAAIGDIVTILSRSPDHKFYAFADIEWMILPAVAAGQFHVVEVRDGQRGFRAPTAVVAWAFVSEAIDQRLVEQAGSRMMLRPDEWKSGQVAWLVLAVGSVDGVNEGFQWLSEGPFANRPLKLFSRAEDGGPRIRMLSDLIVPTQGTTR